MDKIYSPIFSRTSNQKEYLQENLTINDPGNKNRQRIIHPPVYQWFYLQTKK